MDPAAGTSNGSSFTYRVKASGGDDLLAALAHTAHRGFVRHIPVVGPLGDEVEAMRVILYARPEELERLGAEMGWESLADLPSYRAILADRELMEDIDRGGDGDLRAIYRLQKHPRILAFWGEPPVREKVRGLRPTDLVRRIEAGRKGPERAPRDAGARSGRQPNR